jgi:hypothetical protein
VDLEQYFGAESARFSSYLNVVEDILNTMLPDKRHVLVLREAGSQFRNIADQYLSLRNKAGAIEDLLMRVERSQVAGHRALVDAFTFFSFPDIELSPSLRARLESYESDSKTNKPMLSDYFKRWI